MCSYLLQINQPDVALGYVKHVFDGQTLPQLRKNEPRAYSMFLTCAMGKRALLTSRRVKRARVMSGAEKCRYRFSKQSIV